MLEGARTIAGEKGTVTERSFVMVRLLRLSPLDLTLISTYLIN